MENGFKVMSQTADASGGDGQQIGGAPVADNVKSMVANPEQLTEAATERASELQALIIEEIRARPIRALAWAAAAGAILGVWAAR